MEKEKLRLDKYLWSIRLFKTRTAASAACEKGRVKMNEESIKLTLSTGNATYYSRSRKSLWTKGETSGNVQAVTSFTADCDFDCILMKVKQVGVACHTGKMSCFFNAIKS